MSYLLAIIAVALFTWGLRLSGAVAAAGGAVALAKTAMATLADASRSDEEKELVARSCSLRLAGVAARGFAGLAMALAVSLGFLAVPVAARLVSAASLVAVIESWPFVVLSTVAVAAALLLRRR